MGREDAPRAPLSNGPGTASVGRVETFALFCRVVVVIRSCGVSCRRRRAACGSGVAAMIALAAGGIIAILAFRMT